MTIHFVQLTPVLYMRVIIYCGSSHWALSYCILKFVKQFLLRYMWNDGNYLLWQQIVQLFYQDVENGLKLMPRLTYYCIKLNSYSTMRVSLEAQILRSTVADLWSPADLSLFSCRSNKDSSEWRCWVCLNWDVLPRSFRRILWKPKKAWKKKWQPWLEDVWLQQQHHQSTTCRLLSVWEHAWEERQTQIMGQCFKWLRAKEKETMINLYISQIYFILQTVRGGGGLLVPTPTFSQGWCFIV